MGGSSSSAQYNAGDAPTDGFVYDPTRPTSRPTRTRSIASCATIPVYENPRTEIWALSRFADVRDAATDTATFSSENTDITVGLLPQIQSMDPPRHDALRTSCRARSRAGAPTRWSRASARSRAR
jgi:cytochrome P450